MIQTIDGNRVDILVEIPDFLQNVQMPAISDPGLNQQLVQFISRFSVPRLGLHLPVPSFRIHRPRLRERPHHLPR